MTHYAYLNKKYVLEKKAVVSINTHALHYGSGYFAGIRGYWNEKHQALYVFRLRDHIRRFKESGKILGLKQLKEVKNLDKIIIKLLKKNRHKQNTYIRPLVFVSAPILTKFNLSELPTSLSVTTVPLGHYLNVSRGIKVMVSKWRKQPTEAIPPKAKPTGIYLNTSLAHSEARKKGYDEAILLTREGYVSEGSAENIFLVKGDRLITPDENSDILIGITRKTVIQLAQNELGIKTVEKRIKLQELKNADEVFLTGTGAEIVPVIRIGQKKVGNGKVSPITKKLQEMYFEIVRGNNPKYSHWLTKISY